MKKKLIKASIIAVIFFLIGYSFLGGLGGAGSSSTTAQASATSALDIALDNDDIIVDITKSDESLVINDIDTLKKAFKGYTTNQKLIDNAQAFLNHQNTYKVNAIFAAAVSIAETTAGTKGHAVDGKYNWFNIRQGNGEYYTYSNDSEGIEKFFELISNNYFTHTPTAQNSVKTIGADPDIPNTDDSHSYCEGDWKDRHWSNAVIGYMKQMYQKIGIEKTSKDINEEVTDASIKEIMNWSDAQAWKAITGTAYPSKPTFSQVSESNIKNRQTTIKVTIRTGKNTSKEQSITLNKAVAPLYEAFFKDLYDNCSDFYIVSYDGAFVWRNTTGSNTMSAHAFGCAVDINASIKGNLYGQRPLNKEQRDKEPDAVKYSTIYLDSPMLKIAHKYTIVNGSDWTNSNDAMHFSFIGDWTREKAKSRFLKE